MESIAGMGCRTARLRQAALAVLPLTQHGGGGLGLWAGFNDGTVHAYDVASGDALRVMTAHHSPVACLLDAPGVYGEASRICSLSAAGTVRAWDAALLRERVGRRLRVRQDEFTEKVVLRAFTGAWNVNAQNAIEQNISSWLKPPGFLPPDLYVVGFEEAVELTPANMAFDDHCSEREGW